MNTIKVNYYRSSGEWCYATWIDGEFDGSDTIETVNADASDEQAADAARRMYDHVEDCTVTVHRVDDI